MAEVPYKISGIILSGGKSIRMGENKAFIKINGIPIIQRIYNLFRKLFEETIIVANEKELFHNFDAKIYSDIIPQKGALGGLYTGLFFSSFKYSFCVACDMPFLNESLIKFLIKNIGDYDVIVPQTKDGFHPLHAIYSKKCLQPIKKIIDENKYKIIDLYPMVNVKIIDEKEFSFLDPKMESFININTPEELEKIKKLKLLA